MDAAAALQPITRGNFTGEFYYVDSKSLLEQPAIKSKSNIVDRLSTLSGLIYFRIGLKPIARCIILYGPYSIGRHKVRKEEKTYRYESLKKWRDK